MAPERLVDVAVGVLTRGMGQACQVLIARRCPKAVLGGYWEFPGGKIERGETARQCVAREFVEELDMVVFVGQSLPAITHRYGHGDVRIQPFYCLPRSNHPRNLQVAEHRWVPPSRLCDFCFPPANQSLVRQLIKELNRTHARDEPRSCQRVE